MMDKKDLSRADELISQARKVVIVTHMAPDGDAMGSALAMYNFLSERV